MNWTTTPPTKPGFYAWREYQVDEATLAKVTGSHGKLWCQRIGFEHTADVQLLSGQWLRLVPTEEVEKAFYEGWSCDGVIYSHEQCWITSRAKQIAEGTL